jgi:hypothetical protein
MGKRIAVSFITILLFFSACRHASVNQGVITGKLSGSKGGKLILQELDTREIHSVDSVVPDQSGEFAFTPAISEPGFWLIKAPSGKIIVMPVNAGDSIELTGSADDFPDKIILKGTPEAMALNQFFKTTRTYERMVDSLETLLIDRQDSAGYAELTQNIDNSFRLIWEKQRELETGFINKNPESLSSLVVLNYAFGRSPVLSPEKDLVYYQKLDSALFRKFPENKHVKFHHERVAWYERQSQERK